MLRITDYSQYIQFSENYFVRSLIKEYVLLSHWMMLKMDFAKIGVQITHLCLEIQLNQTFLVKNKKSSTGCCKSPFSLFRNVSETFQKRFRMLSDFSETFLKRFSMFLKGKCHLSETFLKRF